ncbi:hypothetical protein [Paenarthrobacter sp. JL.01a]|uniref:hypothetical protein n=1 Tax=Paenarthrobacter sp. JL.01a TaxID=2979324 RepID=UPI0021C86A03|nr:hypothetical protein [Paenarthrobacter sp. JL.01a]UXM90147.1 hypothetical protein N5P29_12555 [Paenarthrobacter sp. JL.01a]
MPMIYLYGLKWNKNPKYLRPVDAMTEAQARAAWADPSAVFSVSAGPDLEPGKVPDFTITAGVNERVIMDRYQPTGRLASSYSYQAETTIRDGSQLFLCQVDLWRADKTYSTYSYQPDGSGRTMVWEGDEHVVYAFSGLDVSGNWLKPGLSWGDWERVGYHEPDYLPLDPRQGTEIARN